MNRLPGESKSPQTLSQNLAPYGAFNLDVSGAEANLELLDSFNDIWHQLSDTEGQEKAFQVADQLGEHLVKKAIMELYELHGAAVAKLIGEDEYQKALLEKAAYEAAAPSMKAGWTKSPVLKNYAYVSEMLFWYLNEFQEVGIFSISTDEMSSIYYRGGWAGDQDFLAHKKVTILKAQEDGIYQASAPFEAEDGSSVTFVARIALGFGLEDHVDAESEQADLDLIRAKLSFTEARRLSFMGTIPEAQIIFGQLIHRLEKVRDLTPAELRLFIAQEFELQGYDNPFE